MTYEYQSDLMLDVHLAGEIKNAARRAGATAADLKRLAEKDMFAKILPVVLGFSSPVPLVKLKTWKIVSVKRKPTNRKQLLKDLEAVSVLCTQTAEYYLLSKDFILSEEEKHFEVFMQTAEDLGFKSPMTRYDVLRRIQLLAFSSCPADLAPYMLLQEPSLMKEPSGGVCVGKSLHVAMKPAVNRLGAHISLSMNYDSGGSFLQVLYDEADYKYPIESVWMFVRERRLL